MFIQLSRFNGLLQDIKWVRRYPAVPRRYLSTRKIVNYYYSQYNWLNATERIRSHPYYITLELTNICNLSCPQCPTGQKKFGRKPSIMPLNKFKNLVDQLAQRLGKLFQLFLGIEETGRDSCGHR